MVTGVGTLGQYLVVKDDTPFYFKDGNVVWFKNNSKIYIEYICKYMDSKFFIDSIYSSSQGTTVGTFTIINAKTMLVPFPPLNEQKRIVAKIEELLPFIEEYDKKEQKLTTLNQQFPDQLKKSILQAAIQGQLVAQDPNDEPASELIKRIQAEKERLISEKKIKKPKVKSEIAVRDGLPYEIINGIERCIADELPFEIPESWCWVRLNDYLDVRDGTHDTPKYVVSGIPLVTSKNLNNGKLDFSNIKYISEEDHKQISLRSGVDVGDILFAMIGSIGNPVLIKENSNFSIKNIGLFKKYISDTSMEYVYYMLLKLQDDMRKKASGGVQSFVSLSFLRDYLIPIPPLNEQKRIVQKIEELFSHIEFL